MAKPEFSFEIAYGFLQSNGLATEVTQIQESKANLASYDSILKRAMVLESLTRNNLLAPFIANHWPNADTPKGKKKRDRLNEIYQWHQRYKTLTCQQIRDAVQEYNDVIGLREGHALRAALTAVQTLPWSLGRLMEVCVVADWGTIPLNNFSFGNRIAMAQEIEASWPRLQWIRTLPAESPSEIVMRTEVVDVLSTYTRLLPEQRAEALGGKQLSFLSKYLHFCISDTFPIWDSNALKVLGGNEQRTWVSYKEWLNRVRQEVTKHKQCLEQIRQGGESLVRTLDKALYTIGSELP